jgi:hypothetical protein
MAKHEARPRDRKLDPTNPDRIPRPEHRSFTIMDRVYDAFGGLVAVFSAVVISQIVLLGGDAITAAQENVPWNHHSDVETISSDVIAPAAFSNLPIVLR